MGHFEAIQLHLYYKSTEGYSETEDAPAIRHVGSSQYRHLRQDVTADTDVYLVLGVSVEGSIQCKQTSACCRQSVRLVNKGSILSVS